MTGESNGKMKKSEEGKNGVSKGMKTFPKGKRELCLTQGVGEATSAGKGYESWGLQRGRGRETPSCLSKRRKAEVTWHSASSSCEDAPALRREAVSGAGPRGTFPSVSSGGEAQSPAHRPPKPWFRSVLTKATPPSLGQAALAASRSQSGPSTSLTRGHAPKPGLSSFLTESRDAELWPRPQRGPAPATPPSDLKRLGLWLTQESRAGRGAVLRSRP